MVDLSTSSPNAPRPLRRARPRRPRPRVARCLDASHGRHARHEGGGTWQLPGVLAQKKTTTKWGPQLSSTIMTWVIKCPHFSHHPTIRFHDRYMVYNGYYFWWCPIYPFYGTFNNPCMNYPWITLWLFNIAMENYPLIQGGAPKIAFSWFITPITTLWLWLT